MNKPKTSYCAHCDAMSVKIKSEEETTDPDVTLVTFQCAICLDTFTFYRNVQEEKKDE